MRAGRGAPPRDARGVRVVRSAANPEARSRRRHPFDLSAVQVPGARRYRTHSVDADRGSNLEVAMWGATFYLIIVAAWVIVMLCVF